MADAEKKQQQLAAEAEEMSRWGAVCVLGLMCAMLGSLVIFLVILSIYISIGDRNGDHDDLKLQVLVLLLGLFPMLAGIIICLLIVILAEPRLSWSKSAARFFFGDASNPIVPAAQHTT